MKYLLIKRLFKGNLESVWQFLLWKFKRNINKHEFHCLNNLLILTLFGCEWNHSLSSILCVRIESRPSKEVLMTRAQNKDYKTNIRKYLISYAQADLELHGWSIMMRKNDTTFQDVHFWLSHVSVMSYLNVVQLYCYHSFFCRELNYILFSFLLCPLYTMTVEFWS